jgi:hypothetical protein
MFRQVLRELKSIKAGERKLCDTLDESFAMTGTEQTLHQGGLYHW